MIKNLKKMPFFRSVKTVFSVLWQTGDDFKAINYPFELTKHSLKSRGMHALRLGENGETLCVFCGFCQNVCPCDALKINRETNDFSIDYSKCVFCGLCEEVCPENAIVHCPAPSENSFEKPVASKHRLLMSGKDWEPVIRERLGR